MRGDTRLEERACAEARVFLVDDRGDDHLAAEVGVGGARGGGAHRGDAGLHVGRAAAVESPVALVGREGRVRHARDVDRVEMAIEHEGAAAVTAADAREHVRAARDRVDEVDCEAPLLERRREQLRDRALSGRARGERGIA